jgi:DnaJ-class molecular chaperone
MTTTCPACKGTGESAVYGYLDCQQCTAAVERTALNEAVKVADPMTPYDERWFAYQKGMEARDAYWKKVAAGLIRDHLEGV